MISMITNPIAINVTASIAITIIWTNRHNRVADTDLFRYGGYNKFPRQRRLRLQSACPSRAPIVNPYKQAALD
jgi:hypothetical protein